MLELVSDTNFLKGIIFSFCRITLSIGFNLISQIFLADMINWSGTLLCHIFVDHVLHHLATTWSGKWWSTATILLLLWWSLTAAPILLVARWDGPLSLLMILTAYSELDDILRRLILRAKRQGWLLDLVLLRILLHRLIKSFSYERLEWRGVLWLLPNGESLKLRK